MNILFIMKGEVTLNHHKKTESIQLYDLDVLLKDFFLDPHTSLLDQYEFRIDLFETNNEIIIEALLENIDKNKINIEVHEKDIIIKVNDTTNKQRKVTFPFHVWNKQITAHFENDILEIIIEKYSHLSKYKRSVSIN